MCANLLQQELCCFRSMSEREKRKSPGKLRSRPAWESEKRNRDEAVSSFGPETIKLESSVSELWSKASEAPQIRARPDCKHPLKLITWEEFTAIECLQRRWGTHDERPYVSQQRETSDHAGTDSHAVVWELPSPRFGLQPRNSIIERGPAFDRPAGRTRK